MESITAAWPIISMLLGAASFMLWFLLIETRRQVKDAQKELSDFKVSAAEKYASREDLRIALDHINSQLQRLNEKIDKMREDK